MANIFKPSSQNISKAADLIKSGGIVCFPTETVYGIGADVFNTTGIAKIFEAKNRPFFDPLIVHIADIEDLDKLAVDVSEKALTLASKFWPGPLTIIFEKNKDVPDIVTSGLSTVAVRMPNNDIAINLILESQTPIAAPSANPFGYLSPTTAQHVFDYLGDKVDIIIDGGACNVGIESTIIKISEIEASILRPGGISREEIEKVIGKTTIAASPKLPDAPGQLPSHYSPLTPLKIVDEITENLFADDALFLFYKKPNDIKIESIKGKFEYLSFDGCLYEAAANVFSALHKLDKLNGKIIYAEKVPEYSLGYAINDRLIKASNKI